MKWSFRDKVRIFFGFWGMRAMDGLYRLLYWLSRGRVYIPLTSAESRTGDFFLWLCGEGYLYGDWRRNDMPPRHD